MIFFKRLQNLNPICVLNTYEKIQNYKFVNLKLQKKGAAMLQISTFIFALAMHSEFRLQRKVAVIDMISMM